MKSVHRWIEKSPYTAALGVELEALSGESARLRLPYQDANTNPGKALHGGCAASLGVVGAQAVTRAALGETFAPFHTCSLQVNYLAAAIDEAVVAEAKLLRRGKEICFAEVDVHTEDGKPIAHVTSAVRGRAGREPAALIAPSADDGAADPGSMGPHIGKMPFIGRREIRVEHMAGARSRLVMPFGGANADESGGVHEGALLALMDTTGAMASWADAGVGRYKASTPSMQAQILAPPVKDDLVGYGRVVQRDDEIFWSDVEVASAGEGRLVARGTVIYRIVT